MAKELKVDGYEQFEIKIGGKKVIVETGKYCSMANGSCILRCGETVVMVNATMNKTPRPNIDFFPLQVDFEEKMYAVGKIPGGFKKREGRASDKAILASRLIDRPLRPLFPKGFYNDVAVIATPVSIDPDIYPEPLAMLGSSIALSISDIPFGGPTGSVVVGLIGDKYIVNPNLTEREQSRLHATVSGTKDAILMVEAAANEVTEEEMLKAIAVAHEEIIQQCKFQEKLTKKIGKEKAKVEMFKIDSNIDAELRAYADKAMDKVLANFAKKDRSKAEDELEEDVLKVFGEKYPDNMRDIKESLYNLKKDKVRANIVDKGLRPDGRKTTEIRPIWCEVGILPRTHGSAVFTRGQTQAMTLTTLGMLGEVQKLEGIDEEEQKRYMHHYNMPGYSTAEAKGIKGTGRREIGHGALAEKALEPVLPTEEEFPYSIRTVSEILSSNGSTSQASVCGSTLSLMDAGVPLRAPVAGIAMGLIKDESKNKTVVLSDIQGLEDFLGDMDFKVAGTEKGITAIQMDMKIKGIGNDILTTALKQAKVGRIHILGEMFKAITEPRTSLSKYAPKIITFNIDPEKIGDVVGKAGKVINEIIKQTGVKIDIEDNGKVCVASTDEAMQAKAKDIILTISNGLQVGKKYSGKVARIMQFGAIVEIAPGVDGMIHISKLSDKRVDKVEDIVKIGDEVDVEVLKTDDRGRVDLKLLPKVVISLKTDKKSKKAK